MSATDASPKSSSEPLVSSVGGLKAEHNDKLAARATDPSVVNSIADKARVV